jgi:hypothetical protein
MQLIVYLLFLIGLKNIDFQNVQVLHIRTEYGINAAYINSSLTQKQQKEIEQDLISGHIQFLYVDINGLITIVVPPNINPGT